MGGSVVANLRVWGAHVGCFLHCECHLSIVFIVICEALQVIIALLAVCIRFHVPCSIIVRHMGPHNRCFATAVNMRGPAPPLARTLSRL
jgi:hypothetical protein